MNQGAAAIESTALIAALVRRNVGELEQTPGSVYLSTAIFFITGFVRTIPPELEEAARVDGVNNWHLIFAYVVLMSVPLVLVFAVAQRRIISGITGGAVK